MIKEVSAKPFVKWGSAFCSGAIGSALFNPIDLVKVRFQSAQGDTPSGVIASAADSSGYQTLLGRQDAANTADMLGSQRFSA